MIACQRELTLRTLGGGCGLALSAWLVLAGCSDRPTATSNSPATAPATAEPDECHFQSWAVRSDRTLRKACSPFIIRGGIDLLDHATLTIEPGVEMRFRDRDWLEIGAAGTRGSKLIARGTEQEPIVLTSESPETTAKGTWFGVWFNAGSGPGSEMSHVVVRAAGGRNKHIKPPLRHGCITLTEVPDGAVSIDHVSVEDCVQAGLVLRASRPKLEHVRVRNTETGVLMSPELPDAVVAGVGYHGVKRPTLRDGAL